MLECAHLQYWPIHNQAFLYLTTTRSPTPVVFWLLSSSSLYRRNAHWSESTERGRGYSCQCVITAGLLGKGLKKRRGKVQSFTICNIFCNSFKQNYVYKSPKHIELFTIQAVMCHTDDILRNKSDLRILNKSQGRAYFVTVLNKLTSTHLPKTLIYILYNTDCYVSPRPYIAQ